MELELEFEHEKQQQQKTVPSVWRYQVHAISDLLKSAVVGEIVSYSRIMDSVGCSDLERIQALCRRAFRSVREDPGYVFRVVETVGYRRLSDAEIATDLTEESRRKQRRHLRRTREELDCVKNFASLKPEERSAWNTAYALGSVLETILSPGRVESIKSGVSNESQQKLAHDGLISAILGLQK